MADFDAGAVIANMQLAYDQLGKGIAEVKKQMMSMEKTSTAATKKVDTGWQSLKKAIMGVSVAYLGKQLLSFGNKALGAFAKVENQTVAADRRLKEYGTTWEEVRDKMRKATGNMISDADLLKQTTRGLAFGFDPSQIEEFATIARGAAQELGEDIDYMFESLVTGTARQSKLWIDNLGIIIDTNEANAEYAKEIGKSADKLSDFEKKQAFTNAVLKEGNKQFGEAGRKSAGLQGTMAQLTAIWDNFTVIVGGFLDTAGFGEALAWWAQQASILATWLQETVKWLRAFKKEMASEEEISEKRQSARETRAEIKKKEDRLNLLSTADEDVIDPGTGLGFVVTPEKKAAVQKEREILRDEIAQLNTAVESLDKQADELEGALYNPPSKPAGRPRPEKPEEPTNKGNGPTAMDLYGNEAKAAEDAASRKQAAIGREMDARALAAEDMDNEYDRQIALSMLEEERLQSLTTAYEEAYSEQARIVEESALKQEEKIAELDRLATEHNEKMLDMELERQRAARATGVAEKTKAEAYKASYTQAARVGAKLLIDDQRTLAAVEGGFEIAAATKEMGEFLGTKDPSHLVSSLEHALAAKQFFAVAKQSSASAKSGGGGGGPKGKNKKDKGGLGGQEGEDTGTWNVSVVFQGHSLISEQGLQQFVVNEFGPAVEKAVKAGRLNQTWTRE